MMIGKCAFASRAVENIGKQRKVFFLNCAGFNRAGPVGELCVRVVSSGLRSIRVISATASSGTRVRGHTVGQANRQLPGVFECTAWIAQIWQDGMHLMTVVFPRRPRRGIAPPATVPKRFGHRLAFRFGISSGGLSRPFVTNVGKFSVEIRRQNTDAFRERRMGFEQSNETVR